MAYWTHYWRNDTVRDEADAGYDRLTHTADDTFLQRGVQPGDTVYVVSNFKGTVYVLGRLIVDQILNQGEAEKRFGGPVWEATDHLIATDPATELHFDVTLPEGIVDDVKFITASGTEGLKFDQREGADPGTVDRQTLRGVREITADTAGLFNRLLGL